MGNRFSQNSGYGIEINGSDTLRNIWSRNQIYENARGGISAGGGALLLPTAELEGVAGNTLTGISTVGGIVEVFADLWPTRSIFFGQSRG